jgi:hypothetical protein
MGYIYEKLKSYESEFTRQPLNQTYIKKKSSIIGGFFLSKFFCQINYKQLKYKK